MQPRERRETGEQDLFRSRLDQIIDIATREKPASESPLGKPYDNNCACLATASRTQSTR